MIYNGDFYDFVDRTSMASAAIVVPIVMELLHPRSVIDVGCGQGAWLAHFAEQGASMIAGLDGDYVDRNRLMFNPNRFIPKDLSAPFSHPDVFDLVVSLEVAEHLPKESARQFVSCLTRLGRNILFSAAVPGQGGTNHVNEQWPDYWAALFAECRYRAVDAIRPRIWSDGTVAVWYRQNCLLFIEEGSIPESGPVRAAWEWTRPNQLSVVHPDLFELISGRVAVPALENFGVRHIMRRLPRMLARSLSRRLGAQSLGDH